LDDNKDFANTYAKILKIFNIKIFEFYITENNIHCSGLKSKKEEFDRQYLIFSNILEKYDNNILLYLENGFSIFMIKYHKLISNFESMKWKWY